MTMGLSTKLNTTFEDAVERTTRALADQGFGVLTRIDVKSTLKQKLGADMEEYLILGACNPTLAHRAWRWTARSDNCCPATSWCAPIQTARVTRCWSRQWTHNS